MRKNKAVVLLSGGLDSSTLLAYAVKNYGRANVLTITADYGQKHRNEISAAINVSEYYGVRNILVDMAAIFKYSDSALMFQSTTLIPEGSYKSQARGKHEPLVTYVPYRNGMFLSAAAAIALSIFKQEQIDLYYGAHADDGGAAAYPDTSAKFVRHQARALWLGSGKKIKMVTPFVKKRKADLVKLGLELNAPYHLTWSCYKGQKVHCGECSTCIDRQKAFAINGVTDPVKYAKK